MTGRCHGHRCPGSITHPGPFRWIWEHCCTCRRHAREPVTEPVSVWLPACMAHTYMASCLAAESCRLLKAQSWSVQPATEALWVCAGRGCQLLPPAFAVAAKTTATPPPRDFASVAHARLVIIHEGYKGDDLRTASERHGFWGARTVAGACALVRARARSYQRLCLAFILVRFTNGPAFY